jgi:hypothetical protein
MDTFHRQYMQSLATLKEQKLNLQDMAIYENAFKGVVRSGTDGSSYLNLEKMKAGTCKSILKLWEKDMSSSP